MLTVFQLLLASGVQSASTPSLRGAHLQQKRLVRVQVLPGLSHDPYCVLGLHAGASTAEVKAAYRVRAKQCHPDRNPSAAAVRDFHMLTQAVAQLVRDRNQHYHSVFSMYDNRRRSTQSTVPAPEEEGSKDNRDWWVNFNTAHVSAEEETPQTGDRDSKDWWVHFNTQAAVAMDPVAGAAEVVEALADAVAVQAPAARLQRLKSEGAAAMARRERMRVAFSLAVQDRGAITSEEPTTKPTVESWNDSGVRLSAVALEEHTASAAARLERLKSEGAAAMDWREHMRVAYSLAVQSTQSEQAREITQFDGCEQMVADEVALAFSELKAARAALTKLVSEASTNALAAEAALKQYTALEQCTLGSVAVQAWPAKLKVLPSDDAAAAVQREPDSPNVQSAPPGQAAGITQLDECDQMGADDVAHALAELKSVRGALTNLLAEATTNALAAEAVLKQYTLEFDGRVVPARSQLKSEAVAAVKKPLKTRASTKAWLITAMAWLAEAIKRKFLLIGSPRREPPTSHLNVEYNPHIHLQGPTRSPVVQH